MNKKLPCYLKTYRKRAGLTQKELAHLLGISDDTVISKLEHRRRKPSLKIVIGCQLLFGEKAENIFPDALSEIKADVRKRIRRHDLSDKNPSL
ncbi:helix-turn-helix transcriptional regulator [uncultured Sneathiella sp.]|jgi:DNA-binding XRE family transcriptional regulator|uniref:helix-turn-helix transcriptional regulator n=1 Tax=uncultured Sneathiella sp. TaxID=879315 RepID=UPI0030DB2099|tara:strand:- start:15155 stop:15433 length:279 start_codon:yes stop_codon:yes gene_type:complete